MMKMTNDLPPLSHVVSWIIVLAVISLLISTIFWVKAMLRYGENGYVGTPPSSWFSYLPWPAITIGITSFITIPTFFIFTKIVMSLPDAFVRDPFQTLAYVIAWILISFFLLMTLWKFLKAPW